MGPILPIRTKTEELRWVMDVAIVKYNAGNIYSVVNAMKRLGIEPVLTDDAEMLQKADRVLFPGRVGKGSHGISQGSPAGSVIKNLKQPVLGICVGQQLLCRHSEEGDVDCIGIFNVDVKRFQPQKHEDKGTSYGMERDIRSEDGALQGIRKQSRCSRCCYGRSPSIPTLISYTATMCHSARRPSPRLITFCLTAHRSTKITSIPASSIRKRAER